VLFTNAFPTSFSQENYLIEEIAFLSKAFERVIIVPIEKESVKHSLPANVEVTWLNNQAPLNFFTKFWYLLKHSSLLVKESKAYGFGFRDLKVLAQELLVAKFYAEGITKLLSKHNLNMKDTLFYNYWCNTFTLSLALLKRREPELKFVSRGHQADVYFQAEQKVRTSFYVTKLQALHKLFVISEHGANYLSKRYPFFSLKITKAYLGVKDRRENPFKTQDYFTIVSVSKLGDNKRVFAIPEILNHLDFNVKWVHFGSSGPEDVKKVVMAANKLRPNIHFEMKGLIPNDQILQYYQNTTVNLFINVSIVEGLSFAAIEALSFGIPMILTETNGAPELIRDNGYTIPVNYAAASVASLIKAMKGRNEKILRNNSRALFLERFDATKNYNDFVFKGLLS